MNNIEYYKSLISDEEVIKALVKESKARNDLLKERTRVRPNLRFFQRTVSNLVTSNNRVTITKELYKEKEEPGRKIRGKVKTPDMLVKETIISNKINTVKTEERKSDDECDHSTKSRDTSNIVGPVEETYKERLSKYFVPALEGHTSNKSTKNRKLTVSNMSKPKTIVFNLNFSKDRLEKPEGDLRNVASSKSTLETTVLNLSGSDVIRISDSESD